MRWSFRDLPRTGATQFYLRPEKDVSVAALLSDVARGYYLIEASGSGSFDYGSGRFSLPVCGFEIENGRPAMAVSRIALEGDLYAVLANVRAVARDLTFTALGAMVGSPTIRVDRISLRPLD